ncbi:ATP-binding protein [Planococcus alpniumensis]|uniref:ATP-binding protein n=1 Tax=Planococcus alpniumensis TaxID=2708345 RepID=UPI001B8AD509|nr:sensor histidine kinase [Planococcus sp. MSAK28401]
MKKLSLQTKIILLTTSLVLLTTVVFGGILSYQEIAEIKENIGQRAQETAIGISAMPTIVEAMDDEEPALQIQPLAEYLRKQVGAEFIVIGNRESIRYSHPDPEKIGESMVGGDNERALQEGKVYVSEAFGSLGRSLRGKAPIYDGDGRIIGVVSVGYMIEDIEAIIFGNIMDVMGLALLTLVIGVLGSILLAKNIRKDTLGLEPREIARLYQDREALLSSIIEGVIAIDKDGRITELNSSAEKMLAMDQSFLHTPSDDILPELRMGETLTTGNSWKNKEILIGGTVFIVNQKPIWAAGEMVGAVSTFREKTEVQEVLETLSEIRQYSESLRAQTHEYANKLYAISGLLQLEETEEAVRLIQQETNHHEKQTKHTLNHIEDKKVQAILLGKMGKASEAKVELSVDENSSLAKLPAHVDISKVIHIVGNLIDNAIEEVESSERKEVSFFITDIGHDLVIEVQDSGRGIETGNLDQFFTQGFSTKLEKADRGYGLAIVKQAVEDLNGWIEVDSTPQRGTVFSVFIPKKTMEVA